MLDIEKNEIKIKSIFDKILRIDISFINSNENNDRITNYITEIKEVYMLTIALGILKNKGYENEFIYQLKENLQKSHNYIITLFNDIEKALKEMPKGAIEAYKQCNVPMDLLSTFILFNFSEAFSQKLIEEFKEINIICKILTSMYQIITKIIKDEGL